MFSARHWRKRGPRGVQFFTPVFITARAMSYGIGGGISLAAIFALLTGGLLALTFFSIRINCCDLITVCLAG